MQLKNEYYDVLKYIAMIALPAIGVFVQTVGENVNWEYTSLTVTIIQASTVLLSSLLMVSTAQYNKQL